MADLTAASASRERYARPLFVLTIVTGSFLLFLTQQAISRAEAARAPTTGALAELDRLATDRAAQPTNDEDFAAIHGALQETERLAARQQQEMERLRAAVRR